MREEIKGLELEQVSGGRYFINTERKLVVFQNVEGVFKLKVKPYLAMEVMDSLIGKFETEAEYDQACVEALTNLGMI